MVAPITMGLAAWAGPMAMAKDAAAIAPSHEVNGCMRFSLFFLGWAGFNWQPNQWVIGKHASRCNHTGPPFG
jgi:hypothetical protein